MLDLLFTVETSFTAPKSEKKAHQVVFSDVYMDTLCIWIFLVPMYSIWSQKDLVVGMLPANAFAASSVASRMSYMALDMHANTLAAMFKSFRASSTISLVTAINFLVLTSVVNRETVLVVTASITDITTMSLLPEINELYSHLRLLLYSGTFLGLSAAHTEVDGGIANGSFC